MRADRRRRAGETWYAVDEKRTVDLTRPYIRLGAPPKWRIYDVTPLHWIYRTDKKVDFISDDDLEHFKSSRQLGLRGQMTYYERGRARVFASGILDVPSTAYYSPYRQVLDNVWERLSKP